MSTDDLRRSDDVQIGKLIQSVENLSREVDRLRQKVEGLEEKANTSKGVFYGALFAAGGMGAGLAQLFDKIFHP